MRQHDVSDIDSPDSFAAGTAAYTIALLRAVGRRVRKVDQYARSDQ